MPFPPRQPLARGRSEHNLFAALLGFSLGTHNDAGGPQGWNSLPRLAHVVESAAAE